MIVPSMLARRGDDPMKELPALRISNVGKALFVISLLIGAGVYNLTDNRAPLIGMALAGLYFLFSIRVADQWERVAVLRFGKYTGLKGPGMFYMIPIVDTVTRYVDQRVRVS